MMQRDKIGTKSDKWAKSDECKNKNNESKKNVTNINMKIKTIPIMFL
jgi:hypothetical protein